MPKFTAFGQLEAWLNSLGLFHMRLGLERMTEAMRRLDLQKLPFACAQVLGTNGKGSTSAFIEALARVNGYATGLFTSPHFLSCKERILINGRQASDVLWLDAANELYFNTADLGLTYFEALTMLALLMFVKSGINLAVFEAGLGGRNDATTAIPVQAQALTPVAMDHAAVIGPTIEDIVADKAAALRCADFYSARQYPQVAERLDRAKFVQEEAFCADFRLPGMHQRSNFNLALAVWGALVRQGRFVHRKGSELEATAAAFIPGRVQKAAIAAKTFILDGAHNPHALKNLAKTLQNMQFMPQCIIFSCLADKNWQAGAAILAKAWPKAQFMVAQLENERAEDANKIAAWLRNSLHCGTVVCQGPNALQQALAQARERTLICGSFYLLTDFYKLYPQYLENWGETAKD